MAQDSGHDERRSCWSGSSVPLAEEPCDVTRRPKLTCRGLREPCGALAPILNSGSAASAIRRSGLRLDPGALLGPSCPLSARHLSNHELARRDLRSHVLELRLARLMISLPTRLSHVRSLPFMMSGIEKTAANQAGSRPTFTERIQHRRFDSTHRWPTDLGERQEDQPSSRTNLCRAIRPLRQPDPHIPARPLKPSTTIIGRICTPVAGSRSSLRRWCS